jgi:cytochrome bd-type quinol oxidase subunit 1
MWYYNSQPAAVTFVVGLLARQHLQVHGRGLELLGQKTRQVVMVGFHWMDVVAIGIWLVILVVVVTALRLVTRPRRRASRVTGAGPSGDSTS